MQQNDSEAMKGREEKRSRERERDRARHSTHIPFVHLWTALCMHAK